MSRDKNATDFNLTDSVGCDIIIPMTKSLYNNKLQYVTMPVLKFISHACNAPMTLALMLILSFTVYTYKY